MGSSLETITKVTSNTNLNIDSKLVQRQIYYQAIFFVIAT